MSGSVRVKICGIRQPEDALAAVEAGADLIGVNFVSGSPREVDLKTAEAICQSVDELPVERVAVFQNSSWEEIDRVLRRVEFERIQFHGDESEEELEAVDLPTIKAVRGADLEAARIYPSAILLLDHPTGSGGGGKSWNWSEAAGLIAAGHDVILAGGLDPGNVERALVDLGDLLPWGVDVATGVEGEHQRKDPALLKAFVEAVRRAEESE
ncbi:MAG: phosphoribosylanthranilate isomerase [Myxococcota bacterium]